MHRLTCLVGYDLCVYVPRTDARSKTPERWILTADGEPNQAAVLMSDRFINFFKETKGEGVYADDPSDAIVAYLNAC